MPGAQPWPWSICANSSSSIVNFSLLLDPQPHGLWSRSEWDAARACKDNKPPPWNHINSLMHQITRPPVTTEKIIWLCTAISSTEICSYLLTGGGRGLSKNRRLWNRERLCTQKGSTPQLWHAWRTEAGIYQSKQFLEQFDFWCQHLLERWCCRAGHHSGR